MSSFQPTERHRWERYASRSSVNNLSIGVSASDTVAVSITTTQTHSSVYLTAERARELAAELIAAADSLQTIKEAA
jgi:hypothetical protein